MARQQSPKGKSPRQVIKVRTGKIVTPADRQVENAAKTLATFKQPAKSIH